MLILFYRHDGYMDKMTLKCCIAPNDWRDVQLYFGCSSTEPSEPIGSFATILSRRAWNKCLAILLRLKRGRMVYSHNFVVAESMASINPGKWVKNTSFSFIMSSQKISVVEHHISQGHNERTNDVSIKTPAIAPSWLMDEFSKLLFFLNQSIDFIITAMIFHLFNSNLYSAWFTSFDCVENFWHVYRYFAVYTT